MTIRASDALASEASAMNGERPHLTQTARRTRLGERDKNSESGEHLVDMMESAGRHRPLFATDHAQCARGGSAA
jgi:hypothetical protein